MYLNELKEKPVWQMTGQELLNLLKEIAVNESPHSSTNLPKDTLSKRYVYGIRGIAELFGCSISTANKIKKEGKIKSAILQYGRKIIVDAELALELFSKK
ncbi:DUF3853 family protein [Myroides odoratimimus]|uniref:DUF3853 family protein n=1 Tax=Myroides odoratimimus TaxID=76832 RepID=A0AAI8C6H3_9FLAO|nr:DUF3853 family protein [Myroides odoratimimus]ALU26846.1 hypothetical protein AS202_12115 [Myroides odoratimimus]ALU27485.1 hypothetical protein AS202_15635 [Myroides odoratimimus]MDM1037166.1 DUF3853 family protein [Myroides odoratimimus]MDM1051202.1 DUF3853 family protein [Myroides odoratimimus]WHT72898.1 DUF3853 family protein [Myroides odoratimimus]